MRCAHGSSSAARRGPADEDRACGSRVSLTPVTLNGPEMSTPGIVGARSISGSMAIGCSGESDCANERCTNATPTRCGPAFTFTRMWLKRACISSAAIGLPLVDGLQIFAAADVCLEHAHVVDRHDRRGAAASTFVT